MYPRCSFTAIDCPRWNVRINLPGREQKKTNKKSYANASQIILSVKLIAKSAAIHIFSEISRGQLTLVRGAHKNLAGKNNIKGEREKREKII